MPALLRIKKYIENDIWKITFSLDTASLPESDKDLMRKFGEPTINVGGTFVDEDQTFSYTLPDKFLRVRTDLPYTQEFDSKSPDFELDTSSKALAYETAFVSNYQAAFAILRSMTDTFTGERVVNVI
jgi:hypothetical protein